MEQLLLVTYCDSPAGIGATVRPHGTRPYRTRTSMGHGFEVGPKFFEIHGFTRFCGFLTRESKKSNVVLMGNIFFARLT